jgi:hypothetical protein
MTADVDPAAVPKGLHHGGRVSRRHPPRIAVTEAPWLSSGDAVDREVAASPAMRKPVRELPRRMGHW